VMRVTRSAGASRMMRRQSGAAYEIHVSICRNSLARTCLTYGVVGYGYVSVQTLLSVSLSSRGAR